MNQRNPRRTSTEWAAIIEQYQGSGLSVQAFCEQNNLVPITFHKWKRRLSSSQPADKPAFAPATLRVPLSPASSARSSLSVQLGPSITLTISLEGSIHEQ